MKETNFHIIPAIDILDGKCVRLTQGNYNKVEEFSSNPQEVAKKWIDCGATRLHIVDLNGAKEGYPVNFKVIANLIQNTKATIQVGGGLRTIDTIKNYLSEGASYVILGTQIFKDNNFFSKVLEFYPSEVIIGLDLKDSKIALSGWQEVVDIDAGIKENINKTQQIIYTDVSKDGTLSGPNTESLKTVASSYKSNVIVSGGISSLNDINEILNIKKKHLNISGVILGKSLYKGSLNLTDALNLVDKQG